MTVLAVFTLAGKLGSAAAILVCTAAIVSVLASAGPTRRSRRRNTWIAGTLFTVSVILALLAVALAP